MMRLILTLLLLVAFPAFADTSPPKQRLNDGYMFTMCNSQSVAGDCDANADATGDEYVVDLGAYYNLTLYSVRSTATSYSCSLVTSDVGHDAGGSTLNQTVSGSTLNASSEVISLSGQFRYVWINCSSIADNVVIVTLTATPGR